MSAENSTGLPVSGQITLETAEDTEAFGRRLAAGLVAGDLVVLGRTTPLTPAQSAEIGRILHPPSGSHPWPADIAAGHFGGEPVPITRAEPVVVAEVSADPAEQAGRRRHALRLLRIRHDS